MKKNLRFYFALYFAKATAKAMRLIGRKATSMPGSWALILCPDFLDRIDKPAKIYGVTGTNGKTTLTNMIADTLANLGVDFICNRYGSNVPTGICSVLIENTSLTGKIKKDVAIFELDERSSPRMFPYMKIEMIAVTNLFRDSLKRNAHVEYIYSILHANIKEETKLLVCSEDPMCVKLGTDNKLFYGMEPQSFESGEFNSLLRDGAICPKCSAMLSYDFTRYHHVGIYHCEECGYTPPERDFLAKKADLEKGTLDVEIKGQAHTFKLMDANSFSIYNQLITIGFAHELGYSLEEIEKAMNPVKVLESRLICTAVGDKFVARANTKGQNPIASSRTLDGLKYFEGERKAVVFILDDHEDAGVSVENICWYFDTDFEYVNKPEFNQFVVEGTRALDVKIRLLMAGIPEEKIKCVLGIDKIPDTVDYDLSDTFIVCHHVHRYKTAEITRLALIEKIKGLQNKA